MQDGYKVIERKEDDLMSTLKSELERLGLVRIKRQGIFEELTSSAPVNRLGKPQIWYKWMIRRKTPRNAHIRCCMCGNDNDDIGLEETERSREIGLKLDSKKVSHGCLKECSKCR